MSGHWPDADRGCFGVHLAARGVSGVGASNAASEVVTNGGTLHHAQIGDQVDGWPAGCGGGPWQGVAGRGDYRAANDMRPPLGPPPPVCPAPCRRIGQSRRPWRSPVWLTRSLADLGSVPPARVGQPPPIGRPHWPKTARGAIARRQFSASRWARGLPPAATPMRASHSRYVRATAWGQCLAAAPVARWKQTTSAGIISDF